MMNSNIFGDLGKGFAPFGLLYIYTYEVQPYKTSSSHLEFKVDLAHVRHHVATATAVRQHFTLNIRQVQHLIIVAIHTDTMLK